MSHRASGGRQSVQVAGIEFGRSELRDLGVAWLALSVAFTLFFAGGGRGVGRMLNGTPFELVGLGVISFVTAGLGFILHEVAHKVLAVRYGQVAEFRANYQMLGIAVVAALAGIIFAAPGAVHHRGRITKREGGLIALAGPLTNVALGVVFAVPLVLGLLGAPLLGDLGLYGVAINLFLAGFNMLPFGPLDGKTVLSWDPKAYAAAAAVTILPGVGVVLLLF